MYSWDGNQRLFTDGVKNQCLSVGLPKSGLMLQRGGENRSAKNWWHQLFFFYWAMKVVKKWSCLLPTRFPTLWNVYFFFKVLGTELLLYVIKDRVVPCQLSSYHPLRNHSENLDPVRLLQLLLLLLFSIWSVSSLEKLILFVYLFLFLLQNEWGRQFLTGSEKGGGVRNDVTRLIL